MKLRLLLGGVSLVVGMNTAMAASPSPVGQWTVTFYIEPGLATGATQGICFGADGTWYSSTFANWRGRWFTAGERFRWTGSTAASLATGAFGQFYTTTWAAGESTSTLTPSGATSSNATYHMTRVGSVCNPPASAAPSSADPLGR
jgi:hypothetical protein